MVVLTGFSSFDVGQRERDLLTHLLVRLNVLPCGKGILSFLTTDTSQCPGSMSSNQFRLRAQSALQRRDGRRVADIAQGHGCISARTSPFGALHRAVAESLSKFLLSYVKQLNEGRAGADPFRGREL